MRPNIPFFILLSCLGLTVACHTVKVDIPTSKTVYPKESLLQAKKSLTAKPISRQDIPSVLGGLIQSDRWIIYKDKQQEEFSGHVAYDNGAYIFRADYALSERAKNQFSAQGNVYLRQNNKNGSFYEVYADRGFYNYKTQTGKFYADDNTQLRLIYSDEKGFPVTATARQAQFDLSKKIYVLTGAVHVTRKTTAGEQTLRAQKVTLKQFQNYALLQGEVVIHDGQRSLTADTMEYDGEHHTAIATGKRPLLQGTAEQGRFAVIADKLQGDNDGQQIHLSGNVQGWIVSPQLNNSKINTKF